MGFIVLLVVLALLVFWLIGAYNKLIGLKNQVANAWKQIDVQLKRRHDLIPNLVNTVKGAMQFERETLEAVVAARNQAIKVQQAPGAHVGQTAAAEAQLSGALSRLLAVVEAYPDLKATGNVAQLQEELTSTEDRIAYSRQFYNDSVLNYNNKIQVFPTVILAGMFNFEKREFFEGDPEATGPVKVEF